MALREEDVAPEDRGSNIVYHRPSDYGSEVFCLVPPGETPPGENFEPVAQVDGDPLPFSEGKMYDPLSFETVFREPGSGRGTRRGTEGVESVGKGKLRDEQQKLDKYGIFVGSGEGKAARAKPIVR